MTHVLYADRLITAGHDGAAYVVVEGENIVEVRDSPVTGAVAERVGLLVPGFVDVHCHGGGGADFSQGAAAARRVLAAHLRHGTTAMVASLVSATEATLHEQLRALEPVVSSGELAGVHLEGPWLSPQHAGAHQPQLLCPPSVAQARSLLHSAPGIVRMVTLAPELPGAHETIKFLTSEGVVVALGHSDATYAQATAAIAAGITVGTHVFNAERGIHHREPGPVPALIDDDRVVVELIADGVHLHPRVLRDAFRAARGRAMLVTDAMAAAAAGDGRYDLGGLPVVVSDQVARIDRPDESVGPIAGSVLTLDRAIGFAVRSCGLELAEVVTAATALPAAVLGRDDIGQIRAEAQADLVVLSPHLQVERVMQRGRWVDEG